MDIVERLRLFASAMKDAPTAIIDDNALRRADEIERLRGMLISALDGLDDYWVTLPQGVELVNQIKALQQKEKA